MYLKPADSKCMCAFSIFMFAYVKYLESTFRGGAKHCTNEISLLLVGIVRVIEL